MCHTERYGATRSRQGVVGAHTVVKSPPGGIAAGIA
jgi:hypothetical protein